MIRCNYTLVAPMFLHCPFTPAHVTLNRASLPQSGGPSIRECAAELPEPNKRVQKCTRVCARSVGAASQIIHGDVLRILMRDRCRASFFCQNATSKAIFCCPGPFPPLYLLRSPGLYFIHHPPPTRVNMCACTYNNTQPL